MSMSPRERLFSEVPFPGRVLTRTDVNTTMKQNAGIQIVVEFHYTDASLREDYVSSFCAIHFGSGVTALRSEEECEK